VTEIANCGTTQTIYDIGRACSGEDGLMPQIAGAG
jgi:hypothetical protein